MLTVFELAAPECSAEEFDGEIVAINLDSGIYFSMKDKASLLFTALCDGHAVETILAAIPDEAAHHQDVQAFVHELTTNGLIRPVEKVAQPKAPLSTGFSSFGALGRPILESFGDMQSLLLLDPVHEVDEAIGWPKLPEG